MYQQVTIQSEGCSKYYPVFQIRIFVLQVYQNEPNQTADLHAVRLASFNQIFDPWVYILFRKELVIQVVKFIKSKLYQPVKVNDQVELSMGCAGSPVERAPVED